MTTPPRIGSYPIERELGRGGMGIVYLGRDPRLGRAVAIKVLPDAFAADPERLARFEREAQVLASLRHPNIAGIHGLEEEDGRRFLSLEYVEGPTLAERLRQSRMPLDETLDVARQIAAALEAAHESGIIHRDLKPGNIKLTPAGEVKVLDFGLAKGMGASTSSIDLSQSPTVAYVPTSVGVILGTAAYMSPEQARGKSLDRRTDIWSFGCVLWEMLTGRQLFGGETASDTIAQILERDPDWAKLSSGVPPRVRHLLRRCLEKDARKRLRDIGEARVELEEAIAGLGSKAGTPAWDVSPRPAGRSPFAWSVAIIALAAAAFALLSPRLFPKPAPLLRLSIAQPEGATLSGDAVMFALSPDGRSMAFVAADTSGQSQLWLRELDDLRAVPLAGTDNAMVPFWSPDSRWIGFFADGKLKKVRLRGAVETLCDAPKTRGASWSRSGVIVFAPAGDGPLLAVDPDGGEPRQVTRLDSTLHETAHRYPHFLPDGKHFLYSTVPFGPRGYPIRIGSIDGGPSRALMTADTGPEYADGHLIYLRNRNLVAQPFDPKSMRLRGEPVTLPDMPASSPSAGYHAASVSRTGAFAYLNGSAVRTRLTWFDRSGHVIGIVPIPPGPYSTPILTADEHKVVVARDESFRDADLWMVDLAGGGITRLTRGPLVNNGGVVSADGRLAFETNRDGPFNIYVIPVDGSARETPLVQAPSSFKHPTSWSPDGRQLLFSQLSPGTGFDLWLTPTDGSGPPIPWLRTPYGEEGGWFSPDGRWILYISDETGRYELYAQSYPTAGRTVHVTNIGALNGWWREDGREIIAIGTDAQTFLSIPVLESGGAFRVGPARTLFRSPPNVPGGTMTRDGQRFLLAVPVESPQEPTITVVLNWAGALAHPADRR